jgi:hypothetical protein
MALVLAVDAVENREGCQDEIRGGIEEVTATTRVRYGPFSVYSTGAATSPRRGVFTMADITLHTPTVVATDTQTVEDVYTIRPTRMLRTSMLAAAALALGSAYAPTYGGRAFPRVRRGNKYGGRPEGVTVHKIPGNWRNTRCEKCGHKQKHHVDRKCPPTKENVPR